MSTSNTNDVTVDVPIGTHALGFDDLFKPLAQSADNHLSGGTLSPEVAALVQKMKDLTTQLNDVVAQINQLAPGLLGPTPPPNP
jgi:hypothetical protein